METDRQQCRHRAIARPTIASSAEGGANASTAGVPLKEQTVQGGTVRATYSTNNLQPGDEFLVVILNTAKIATTDYEG